MAVYVVFQDVIGSKLEVCELDSQPVFIVAVLAHTYHPPVQTQPILAVAEICQCNAHVNLDSVSRIRLGAVRRDPRHSGTVAQYLHTGQGNIHGDCRKGAAVRFNNPDGVVSRDSPESALFYLHDVFLHAVTEFYPGCWSAVAIEMRTDTTALK